MQSLLQRLANELKKHNNNRVLTITHYADSIKSYLMDKCTYRVGGFHKAKSKYELPEINRKLCLFVDDVRMEPLIRSMVVYRMINYRKIDDFSIVIGSRVEPTDMVENSCVLEHIDCQPSMYLSIFNNISEGFKPNQLSVFSMLLSPQGRNWYESVKLFKNNT